MTDMVHLPAGSLMPALTMHEVAERRNAVVEFTREAMHEGIDFGVIPGTAKPTLLKPGAEKLCTLFGLAPTFEILDSVKDWTGADHGGEPLFYFEYKCKLWKNGVVIAEGDGSCNSWEKKYRYREAKRVCPDCGQPAIIKGRREFGGGWLCLHPDTPILYADYTWRPIGEAHSGDVVFGFDEYPTNFRSPRKPRPAVIEAVWSSRQQTQRLITAGADIITTAGHRWLQHHRKLGHIGGWHDPWAATDRLRVGNALRSIGMHDAPPLTDDYRMGYLAGITLGDGSTRFVSGEQATSGKPFWWRIALKDTDEAALGRVVAYLAALGIDAYTRPFDSGVRYDGIPYPMKKVEIRSVPRLEAIHAAMQTRETLEYRRGFIAGFFDAEGSGYDHLRAYQKNPDVLHLIQRYAASLGFTFDVCVRDDSRSAARLRGTMLDRFRFFGMVQPALSRKAGLLGMSMHHDPSPILGIEPGPVQDVVDIQTSTGTFFAAGLATHNCFRKQGGCGAKFFDGDMGIESQEAGQVPNPEMPDLVNTIKKMAQKRALVSAALLAVNASEFFTQDLEDMVIEGSFTVQAGPPTPVPVVTAPDTTLLIAELRGARKDLHDVGGELRELTIKEMKAMTVDELQHEIARTRANLEQLRAKAA